jgi:hypothetical protein
MGTHTMSYIWSIKYGNSLLVLATQKGNHVIHGLLVHLKENFGALLVLGIKKLINGGSFTGKFHFSEIFSTILADIENLNVHAVKKLQVTHNVICNS